MVDYPTEGSLRLSHRSLSYRRLSHEMLSQTNLSFLLYREHILCISRNTLADVGLWQYAPHRLVAPPCITVQYKTSPAMSPLPYVH